MNRLKKFVEKNANILKFCCVAVLMLVSFFTLKRELQTINRMSLGQVLEDISLWKIALSLGIGCVCFSFSTIYDQILVRHYKLALRKRDVFKVAWICQSFNYFVGVAGLTGPSLRYHFYKGLGLEQEESEKIIVPIIFLGSIGLHLLALPGYFGLAGMENPLWLLPMIVLFCVGLLFLFADYIPISYFHKKHSPVSYVEKNTRYLLILISLLEWTMAAFFFYFVLRMFGLDLSFLTALAVYIMSIVIGVMSMTPGGIGSFEAAVLFILGQFGMESGRVFFALLLFRLGYYVLPWLIGVLLYSHGKLQQIREKIFFFFSREKICNFLGALVFASGAILILSTATPNILERMRLIERVLPKMLPVYSTWLSFCIGLSLIILSKGIFAGVRRAQVTSIVLLCLVSILCLMKGLDYEEAIFMLLVALALFCSQDSFQHPSNPVNRMAVFLYFGITMLGMSFYFFLYNVTHRVHFLKDTGRYSFRYLQTHGYWLFSVAVFFLIFIFLYLFTNKKYRQFSANSVEEKESFEKIREKNENSAYTHLFYMGDKNVFFNQKKTVFFLYRPYKHNIFVLGDPVGAKEDVEDAIDEMILWANAQGMIVSFYEITGKYLESFVNNGLCFLKLGESANVSLADFTLEGKKASGFRYTLKQFAKEGYSFSRLLAPFSDELLEELEAISKEWLGGRKEIGFSVGAFKNSYLQHASIFVVKNPEGKIVAFVSELPIQNTKVLGIDLMRHIPEVKSGIMEYLFLSMIQWAKENDYLYFDLGIAPLSNVGHRLYASKKEKLIHLAYEYGNKIYSFQGLRSFKQKFHPIWNNVYLSYKDDMALPSILLDITLMIHRNAQSMDDFSEEDRK